MYKVLIIGHGGYPKGIHQALNLIIGEHENVDHKVLDEKNDHDKLEKDLKIYLEKNDHVIIFADLTGGAPHKIGARAIHSSNKKTQFIVSGASLGFLMQLILMTPTPETPSDEVKQVLENTLKDSFNNAKVMSFGK